jgi:hypothetical protein
MTQLRQAAGAFDEKRGRSPLTYSPYAPSSSRGPGHPRCGADAQRLASEFLRATLVSVPAAKTWVPVDNPVAATDAIGEFVPTRSG